MNSISTITPGLHRRRTTGLGILICLLALLGLFLAGLQWVAVSVIDFSRLPAPQPSTWALYGVALASTLSKIALLSVGLAWLRRESWTTSLLLVTVLLSVGEAIWQWQVIVPSQLANLSTEAQRFGYFTGLYVIYFSALIFYLFLFLFLRSKGTRAEFAKPTHPIPPPLHEEVPVLS